MLCSIYRCDDVSSQRFDDTSIKTAGPVSILWHVCSSGTHLIWIQEHRFKCLTPMFNLAAEEHYWVAWYKEMSSLKQSFPLAPYGNRTVRYDDINQMDEIKSLKFHIMFYRFILCSIVYFVVSQNALFTVIPFHHWVTAIFIRRPPRGREEETERPARTQQGARS